ncbi:hypothetical protein [Nevskia sp.]|uniref:hypothetical protein n=1 Tax=Nevskia sp. TaxID=1929292 RepID=UPI0025F0398C|nr:hypothetical protein [Nevskia sp.]
MHARIALRVEFLRRRRDPVLPVRPANASSMDVLCCADLHSKPLISRRLKQPLTIAASVFLLVFLILACAFLGGLR